MTIKEIFNAVSAQDILKEYKKEYNIENDEDFLIGINFIKESFLNIKPKYDKHYSDFFVIVDQYEDELTERNEEIKKYFNVSGYHLNEILENKNDLYLKWEDLKANPQKLCTYGLDFIDRNILATLDVCQLSIDKFGIEKVAAEILYEITFYGWIEDQITEERLELESALDEIKNHPENLKPVNLESFNQNDEEREKDYEFMMEISKRNYERRNKFLLEYLEKYF